MRLSNLNLSDISRIESMYQIGVGKIKLPSCEIGRQPLWSPHARSVTKFIVAVIAHFLASNRFEPCLHSWKGGGEEGRASPSIFQLFPCARGEGEGWKSWKISENLVELLLSRYKILSPWITQACPDRRIREERKIFTSKLFENVRIDFASNRGCD